MSKQFFTSRELADLALEGLPASFQNINTRAKRENWQSRPRQGRGGGKEYHISSLPEIARIDLFKKLMPENESKDIAIITREDRPLSDKQKQVLEARLIILREVEKLAQNAFENRIMKAENIFSQISKRGELPNWLMDRIIQANVHSGKNIVSPATLRRWRTEYVKRGEAGLIPEYKTNKKSLEDYPWLKAFLKYYRIPTKPTIAMVHERMVIEGHILPSLRRVQEIIAAIPMIEREKGRRLPREMKNIKSFTRRAVKNLLPCDVYTADGHKADIELQHPIEGRISRPEIISILDVKTRLCVGFSVGREESSWLVADALRNSIQNFGLPAIFYVDNGCGFKNLMFTDEATGLMGRLGITPKYSRPYNSQARGQVERVHQSLWIRGARWQAGYVGVDMDQEARQKMFKRNRKDLKEKGQTAVLMNMDEFMQWAQKEIDAYNMRPHSGLAKVKGEQGISRHLSPFEAWQVELDKGYNPKYLSQMQLDEMFLPQTVRKVLRGEINFGGKRYFNMILEDYHGLEVRLGYDQHDPQFIRIRNMEGHFICDAELDGNVSDYFGADTLEMAREKRQLTFAKSQAQLEKEKSIMGKIGRVDAKRDAFVAELKAMNDLPIQESTEHDTEILERGAALLNQLNEKPNEQTGEVNGRPIFHTDIDYVNWCLVNKEELEKTDLENIKSYLNSKTQRLNLEINGIDIELVRNLLNDLAA